MSFVSELLESGNADARMHQICLFYLQDCRRKLILTALGKETNTNVLSRRYSVCWSPEAKLVRSAAILATLQGALFSLANRHKAQLSEERPKSPKLLRLNNIKSTIKFCNSIYMNFTCISKNLQNTANVFSFKKHTFLTERQDANFYNYYIISTYTTYLRGKCSNKRFMIVP